MELDFKKMNGLIPAIIQDDIPGLKSGRVPRLRK